MFQIEVGDILRLFPTDEVGEVIDIAYDEFDRPKACVVKIGEEVRGIDLTQYEESPAS
jgi:hypothetical protein